MTKVRKHTGKQLITMTKKLIAQQKKGTTPKMKFCSNRLHLSLGVDEKKGCEVWVVIDASRTGEPFRHNKSPIGSLCTNYKYTVSEPIVFNHILYIEYKTTFGSVLGCEIIDNIKDGGEFELFLSRQFRFFNRDWDYDKYGNCVATSIRVA